MRTPHIVPLARQALEVLEMLRELTGNSEWLFPGDFNAAQPMSNNTILAALARMGFKGRMTGHGFRGLASTILHEQGYPHHGEQGSSGDLQSAYTLSELVDSGCRSSLPRSEIWLGSYTRSDSMG